jgi:hypothetical protein
VREAFDVGEAGFEFREDFESAFGFVLGAWTLRNLLRVLVGTSDVSNRLRGKHKVVVGPLV